MPYTTLDTPSLVTRIDHDLAEVVAAVREADPHVRSIVLTGGFARGEGTVLRGVPQNDYDLVAVRSAGAVRESYAALRGRLETLLGLHIDLAAVPAWRLRHAPPSIFWYETAARGRVLWGEDLLGRIRVREASQLDPREGLRLLANRAAGLLLATRSMDPLAVRIQAAKALLAAFDVHMLAAGAFAPSQAERWQRFQAMVTAGDAPVALEFDAPLLAWAFRFKTAPAAATERETGQLWRSARRVLLEALPVALGHAGLPSLEAAARGDSLLDRVTYALRVGAVPGARRWVLHPTGRVRVATLRLLQATPDGLVDPGAAARCFAGLLKPGDDLLGALEQMRGATRQ